MTRPLSILDLIRMQDGQTSGDAIQRTVEIAQLAEELGYTRVWYAEHHNAPGLASGSPEIIIGHVANRTTTIRLGSGGVMLPNHAPLRIAEVFRLLEAIHPGRIDLGLGRAPGTDTRTAYALRRNPDALTADDYPENLAELLAYEDGRFPEGHIFASVKAIPDDVHLPPIWLLGSSGFSGQLAAQRGLGFSFASHINRPAAVQVMRAYHEDFQQSSRFHKPHGILATSVVLGETIEEAQDLATIVKVGLYRLVSGNGMGPSPTLEQARAVEIPAAYELQMGSMLGNHFVGTPQSVAEEIKAFADEARADEVMISSWIPIRENQTFTLRKFKEAWDQVDA